MAVRKTNGDRQRWIILAAVHTAWSLPWGIGGDLFPRFITAMAAITEGAFDKVGGGFDYLMGFILIQFLDLML